jgi:hypothetical protein
VAVLLCSVGAMVRVVNVRPVGFWDLWCPFAVEVVVGRDGYAVELVGEGFGYAVAMAVVVYEGFDYAVVMAVVVDEGLDYVVELCALAGGGCLGCIASL